MYFKGHEEAAILNAKNLTFWVLFVGIFAISTRVAMDTDTWWHLRAGQWIITQRSIPLVDPFSYTRQGQAWHYPGWLVEVLMYGIYQATGPAGLNLWTAAMTTLSFWFIWRTMRGGIFVKSFTLLLAVIVSNLYWAARPYMVTFLFTSVYLFILESFRRMQVAGRARDLLWLPFLMLIWVNSHGGYAVGFILVGIYAAGEFISLLDRSILHRQGLSVRDFRRAGSYVVIGALMLFAASLNPSGVEMLTYPFKTISIGALREYIQEWQSPNFHSSAAQPFLWLLILFIGIIGASPVRLDFTDFLLMAAFLSMALTAWRNVALFALIAPIIIAPRLAPLAQALGERFDFRGVDEQPKRSLAGIYWFLLLVVIFIAGINIYAQCLPQRNWTVFRRTLPVQAAAYLRAHNFPGRLFNSYNWGGYLLWDLPQYPVFIDGRTDLYDDEMIDQWLKVVKAEPGWESVLDQWAVRLILLETDAPIVSHLNEVGWRLLYEDGLSVIYGR